MGGSSLRSVVRRIKNKLGISPSEKEDQNVLQEIELSSLNGLMKLSSPDIKSPKFNTGELNSILHPQDSHKWRNGAIIGTSFLCILMTMTAYSFFLNFFAYEAKRKGATPFVIGLIQALSPLTVVIMSPIFAYIMKWVRIKYLMAASGLLIGGCNILTGFVVLIPERWLFITTCSILRIVEGAGEAILLTQGFVLITSLFFKHVGLLMGVNEFSVGVGLALGLLLGGTLYQIGGFQLPFVVTAIPLLVMTIPFFLLLRKVDIVEEKLPSSRKVLFKALTDPFFILLIFVIISGLASSTGPAVLMQLYLIDNFHLTSIQIGALGFAQTAIYMMVAPILGYLVDKMDKCIMLFCFIGVLLITAGFITLATPYFTGYQSLWYVGVFSVLSGAGGAVAILPAYRGSYIEAMKHAKTTDDEVILKSYVSGIISSAVNLGRVFGSILAGALNTFMSFNLFSLILAEIFLAEAILVASFTLIKRYI